jgi:hypothetical protein
MVDTRKTPVSIDAKRRDRSHIGGTAFLGENPRPAKTSLDTGILKVAGHVSREGHWGWDGASLEYVPGIAQDPMGLAAGDENLYRYCANEPTDATDPSGLKWHVDRDGKPRATVWNDSWRDTVTDLANMIHLTASEYRKWLKPEGTMRNEMPCDENSAVGRCRVFSVPNTAYIDVSTYSWGAFKSVLLYAKSVYENCFKGLKLDVDYDYPATRAEILAHLSADDIYSYVYIGHGNPATGGMDDLASGDDSTFDVIQPNNRYTKYGIFSMDIIACYSNLGAAGWARNVSSNGGTLCTCKGRTWLFHLELVSQAGTG